MNDRVKTREELIIELYELQQKYDLLKALNRKDIIDIRSKEKTMSLLSHAVMSISECISITDMEDQVIFVNDAFLRTYQYEEHELLGNSITLVRSTKNPPGLTEIILPATLKGGWVGELLNRRKDGNEFPVLLSTSVIRDFSGEPIALIGVTTDITERRRAENALFESELLKRSITDAAQDAIIVMDSKGMISYWNPAAERIFGYTELEAIGQNLHSLIVPQRYHHAHYAAYPLFQETGKGNAVGKTLDLEARKKDGNEIHVQLSLSAIHINEQWHAVGIIRDVSEQKEIQLDLLKAKQEAEIANKFKSAFLANMSHEIRTPLNAIIGFSQLMNRDKLLSDIQKEYNMSIISAGEHLLALINDILELSKIEAGRVLLNPSNVDLHVLLDDIQMIFNERIQSRNLQFIYEKANDLPRYVFVDESKLRQIFVNLIGNALKFTEDGGIAVRIRVDKFNNDSDLLVVEVQDSGCGIASDEIDKLFKHFEQTGSGINLGSGTGLGLALSRELAILMGGNITAKSELGKGSVFTFHVEIKEGNSDVSGKSIAKRVIGIDIASPAYRILVVDDKADNLKVASTLLKLVGFETCEAMNGEEAIVKFQEWNPHLILMDMRMPVMDGYESTRRIKLAEKGKLTPIVALTASTFDDELKKIDSLGIQGFIRKPFRENELFSTIGNILGIKYIYDDEMLSSTAESLFDNAAIVRDIVKLPNSLLLKMQNALAVADLDLLIILIKSIEADHSELAEKLMNLAQNYHYDQLHMLLQVKEK